MFETGSSPRQVHRAKDPVTALLHRQEAAVDSRAVRRGHCAMHRVESAGRRRHRELEPRPRAVSMPSKISSVRAFRRCTEITLQLSASNSSPEGATILREAFKKEGAPVGVLYNLKFTGIRPALEVKVTADMKRIYNHFSAESVRPGLLCATGHRGRNREAEAVRCPQGRGDPFHLGRRPWPRRRSRRFNSSGIRC